MADDRRSHDNGRSGELIQLFPVTSEDPLHGPVAPAPDRDTHLSLYEELGAYLCCHWFVSLTQKFARIKKYQPRGGMPPVRDCYICRVQVGHEPWCVFRRVRIKPRHRHTVMHALSMLPLHNQSRPGLKLFSQFINQVMSRWNWVETR